MKLDCHVIEDLLPLYTEHLLREESVSLVEEHLNDCKKCREYAESMRFEQTFPGEDLDKEDRKVFLRMKTSLQRNKLRVAFISMLFVLLLLVTGYAAADAPEYAAYYDGLLQIHEINDNTVDIHFGENVTDFTITRSIIENGSEMITVEAWTSQWDRLFSHREGLSTTITNVDLNAVKIYYNTNDEAGDTLIYGTPANDMDGVITLPRLALGYYVTLAFALEVIMLVFLFLFRHKKKQADFFLKLAILPLSYMIGHLCILGFTTSSFQMQRDFRLILFVGVLTAGILYLIQGWYLQKLEQSKV